MGQHAELTLHSLYTHTHTTAQHHHHYQNTQPLLCWNQASLTTGTPFGAMQLADRFHSYSLLAFSLHLLGTDEKVSFSTMINSLSNIFFRVESSSERQTQPVGPQIVWPSWWTAWVCIRAEQTRMITISGANSTQFSVLFCPLSWWGVSCLWPSVQPEQAYACVCPL